LAATGKPPEFDGSPITEDASIESARNTTERESNGSNQDVEFEEGFTWKVVAGAIFVSLIMLPGAIYFGLVVGQSLGGAAEWVTIVLFSEIARRSFVPLKRQELYCLFYMASALTVSTFAGGLPGMSGGPFSTLIAMQYLIQSPAMANVAGALGHVPHHWIVPPLGSAGLRDRSFFNADWSWPILIILLTTVFDRMNWLGMGFLLFKLTSDVERLPFPLAAVAASGATALAEAGSKDESWRWRVFSTGSIIGLVFGVVYVGLPIITGVLLPNPLTIIPIPFFDFTASTEHVLPTALVGYNGDLGAVLVGFVLPYQIVFGQFVSSILCQIGLNPILYHMHMFPDWVAGSPTLPSKISLDLDFWMSFNIGIQAAVAVIGIASVSRVLFFSKKTGQSVERASLSRRNVKRGDFPWIAAVGAWLVATIGYISLDHKLVPLFPIEIIIFYGLVWTPLNSYISARMIGLTGQPMSFPFLNQAVVLRSGYSRPDIWFAPLPLADYGMQAQKFREIELTGTKFTSILKLELLMLPMLLISSFAYWGFLWHTTVIPSTQFPYAQNYWPLVAVQRAIWTQINLVGGSNWVIKAIKPNVIGYGAAATFIVYAASSVFKVPLLFFYGLVGGVGKLPHDAIPNYIGALLSRFYFAKRFGVERWSMYAPVLFAGFACGIGLIGMASIAIALICKTVNYLPF